MNRKFIKSITLTFYSKKYFRWIDTREKLGKVGRLSGKTRNKSGKNQGVLFLKFYRHPVSGCKVLSLSIIL